MTEELDVRSGREYEDSGEVSSKSDMVWGGLGVGLHQVFALSPLTIRG